MNKPERQPGEFFGSGVFKSRWWWIKLPLSGALYGGALFLMLRYAPWLFFIVIGWGLCAGWRDSVRQEAKDDMRNWIKRRLHV